MAFLRANRFDPKEAARKIFNFFKYKQNLFGDECLARDISLKDLEEDDLKFLLQGYIQYSPFRDRSGRKIYLTFPGVRTKTATRTELRGRLFLWARSIETMVDVSKGIVNVDYLVGQYQDHLNASGYIEAYDLFKNCIPADVVGNHVCTNNRLERMITNAVCAMMPYHVRVKTRIHFGSHTECQYLLASYGITKGALPLKGPSNEMDLSHVRGWYQQMLVQEQKQQQYFSAGGDAASAASLLSFQQQNGNIFQSSRQNENDVLCLGRVVKGLGNERLQALARRHFPTYENANASSRLAIVTQIIEEIHSHGGRFLKLDGAIGGDENQNHNNAWIELSPEERCTKVTQLFRNFRRRRSRFSPARTGTTPASYSSSIGGQQPSSSSSSPIVVVSDARPEDVLFGHHNVNNNPGNQRLRELVHGVAQEYNRMERGKKKDIVLGLIATIHQSGGRFLMATPSDEDDQIRWQVVSENVTRERISKQFRNFEERGEEIYSLGIAKRRSRKL